MGEEKRPLETDRLGVDQHLAPSRRRYFAPYRVPLLTAIGLRVGQLVHAIGDDLAHEREIGSVANFAPVAFALGVALYFAAPAEPLVGVLVLAAGLPMIAVWRMRDHGPGYLFLLAVALVFTGMASAKVRTDWLSAPTLKNQITAEMSGMVIEQDRNTRARPRYLVRVISIKGVAGSMLPHYVRLSATAKHRLITPGEAISGLVRIRPVSGPAYPGGYDFSRAFFFRRIGASGFFLGAPKTGGDAVLSVTNPRLVILTIGERLRIVINRSRMALGVRIRDTLQGEAGDVAVALINGDRSGLDPKTVERLRATGLAHILAISGLHMALVTLTVVGALRFLFALMPDIATRYPVKKWAVAGGFAAATGYLALSGAGIATQRAWIMISIVLLAVLMDRRALTMRSVAIAALVILLLTPEALLQPGFQMSFAAVAALVAGYEAWRLRARREPDILFTGMLGTATKYLGGIAMTSLIAGCATALFAAYHFHAVAPLGLVANLLAMPVVSLAIMPLAVVSIVLLPFGYEAVTLPAMGWAIEIVLAIAQKIAAISGVGITGLIPFHLFMIAVAGLAILTLATTRLRLIGVPLVLAILAAPMWRQAPDALISQDGRTIALRQSDGRYGLVYPRRGKFITDIWLRAYSKGAASERSVTLTCDTLGCTAKGDALTVAIPQNNGALTDDCRLADVVVAHRLFGAACPPGSPARLISYHDFRANGAHAVFMQANGITINTAHQTRSRPWQQHRQQSPPAD